MKKFVVLLTFIFFMLFSCDLFINLEKRQPKVVDKPTFYPPSGTYYTSIDITISAVTADSYIFFTIDGTTPSKTNFYDVGLNKIILKSKEINTKNITIKAIAYKESFSSEIVECVYKL